MTVGRTTSLLTVVWGIRVRMEESRRRVTGRERERGKETGERERRER